MSTHGRDSDAELSPDVRAELVASRRGRPAGLKLTIPLAALAGVVGWMGVDATKSRSTIEQDLQATKTEVAVLRSEQRADREYIQRSLVRIEAALDELRRERRR